MLTIGQLTSGEGPGARAEGVVISPRKVAVALHIPVSSLQGFSVYPVALLLRR